MLITIGKSRLAHHYRTRTIRARCLLCEKRSTDTRSYVTIYLFFSFETKYLSDFDGVKKIYIYTVIRYRSKQTRLRTYSGTV